MLFVYKITALLLHHRYLHKKNLEEWEKLTGKEVCLLVASSCVCQVSKIESCAALLTRVLVLGNLRHVYIILQYVYSYVPYLSL